MFTLRSIRLCALAAAIGMAMPLAAQAAVSPAINAKVNVRTLQTQQHYDRFIVTYRPGTSEHAHPSLQVQSVNVAIARAGLNRATRSSNGPKLAPVVARHQRRLATGDDLIRTSRKLSAAEATALMIQIAADPAVSHVEPDAMMHAVRDYGSPAKFKPAALFDGAPNDTYYAKYQWHFKTPSADDAGSADVEKAWSIADGAGITVAVLDTGITVHPDIDLSLADAGYDFIIDSFVSGRDTDGRVPGGYDLGDWTTGDKYLASNGGCVDADNPPADSSWHGTHVSGTAVELTNNGIGMAGIAHAAKVLPVRVLGHCGGYTSDIADAIVWASGGHVDGVPDNQNPAQVINMSLGGGGKCLASDVSGKAIAEAISRGTTVVVAAGNSDADAANFSPASCPGAIAVASNGITGKRAFYSNYGSTVAISAPGGGIYPNDGSSGTPVNDGFVWSALNTGTTVPEDPTYGGYAGTSQATPHVTGTVAMILGAETDAGITASTPAEIRNLLTSSARPFPVTEDHPIGAGIVDANAAVLKAINGDGGGGDIEATVLTNGVILRGQSGAAGTSQLYSLTVPAGARILALRSFGGRGNVSMYVKVDSAPAEDGSDADYKSTRPGNTETAVIRSPAAATYYIRIVGVTAYSNLSLLGIYQK